MPKKEKRASVPMLFTGVAIRVRGFDLVIIPEGKRPRIAKWRECFGGSWNRDISDLPLSDETKGDVLRRAYVALFRLSVPSTGGR